MASEFDLAKAFGRVWEFVKKLDGIMKRRHLFSLEELMHLLPRLETVQALAYNQMAVGQAWRRHLDEGKNVTIPLAAQRRNFPMLHNEMTAVYGANFYSLFNYFDRRLLSADEGPRDGDYLLLPWSGQSINQLLVSKKDLAPAKISEAMLLFCTWPGLFIAESTLAAPGDIYQSKCAVIKVRSDESGVSLGCADVQAMYTSPVGNRWALFYLGA
ncbi:MAG: hypothetical protein WCT37_03170 [Patescibacteria group bacterium]|jgi:hypothetical protein